MSTLNIGILAHVDAGKTSLTERLLYDAGVIDVVGRVDDGSTQTDTLALERERGITIKAAVASFSSADVTVNLIDTPGHSDFVAEVERVLRVLDGAVLVVSAVEGVQAQTRVLMRVLQRLAIPTVLFVNKTDRAGARVEGVLREITERLSPSAVALTEVRGAGTSATTSRLLGADDEAFVTGLVDLLSLRDDALLAAYAEDPAAVPFPRLWTALAEQTGKAVVHPVFAGSAITGAGVDLLVAGARELLRGRQGDDDGPVSGSVFKVERGASGEQVALVRLFSGVVRVRDQLAVGSTTGKVTGIEVFASGGCHRQPEVRAGRIARLHGLGTVRIGDPVGVPHRTAADGYQFSPPTLETVVDTAAGSRAALHVALTRLAEQDPLIGLRQDDVRQETSVSLYGEVQKEVVAATLASEYGVDVTFRATTTICVERLSGSGEAVELIGTEPNPFLATVGLRVDPAPVGSGVRFGLEVELGSMPPAFFTAVEETVRLTLGQGLHGWEVPDCAVTMTRAGYWARQSHAHGTFDASMSSTAGDFRHLTPLVLMSALRRAGTVVHEPLHRYELEVPADTLGPVLTWLARRRSPPYETTPSGTTYLLTGEVPAAVVHEVQRDLPTPTRGEGVLVSTFERYRAVTGEVPSRPRTDHDPRHRREYLLRVARLRD